MTKNEKRDEWKQKRTLSYSFLRFPALSSDAVDKSSLISWLTNSDLFAETEGFVISIQDEIVPIRNYQKHIIGDNIVMERCRLCQKSGESIQHVIGWCSSLI